MEQTRLEDRIREMDRQVLEQVYHRLMEDLADRSDPNPLAPSGPFGPAGPAWQASAHLYMALRHSILRGTDPSNPFSGGMPAPNIELHVHTPATIIEPVDHPGMGPSRSVDTMPRVPEPQPGVSVGDGKPLLNGWIVRDAETWETWLDAQLDGYEADHAYLTYLRGFMTDGDLAADWERRLEASGWWNKEYLILLREWKTRQDAAASATPE